MDIFIRLETSVGKRRKDEHFHSNFFLLGKQFLYCFDLLAPSLEPNCFLHACDLAPMMHNDDNQNKVF